MCLYCIAARATASWPAHLFGIERDPLSAENYFEPETRVSPSPNYNLWPTTTYSKPERPPLCNLTRALQAGSQHRCVPQKGRKDCPGWYRLKLHLERLNRKAEEAAKAAGALPMLQSFKVRRMGFSCLLICLYVFVYFRAASEKSLFFRKTNAECVVISTPSGYYLVSNESTEVIFFGRQTRSAYVCCFTV